MRSNVLVHHHASGFTLPQSAPRVNKPAAAQYATVGDIQRLVATAVDAAVQRAFGQLVEQLTEQSASDGLELEANAHGVHLAPSLADLLAEQGGDDVPLAEPQSLADYIGSRSASASQGARLGARPAAVAHANDDDDGEDSAPLDEQPDLLAHFRRQRGGQR